MRVILIKNPKRQKINNLNKDFKLKIFFTPWQNPWKLKPMKLCKGKLTNA